MHMPNMAIPVGGVITGGLTSTRRRRLIGAVVAVFAVGALGVAAWLEPSPDGLGTHSQVLNMPPCGWIAMIDLPCPTCGMTTSFAHAAEGNLLEAFVVQPMGAFLSVVVAMALVVGLYVALTGSRVASLAEGAPPCDVRWARSPAARRRGSPGTRRRTPSRGSPDSR